MTKQPANSLLRLFLIDFVVIVFLFVSLLFVTTMVSVMITGSRETGMGFGVVIGFISGVCIFYYIRGRFNFIWTTIQILLNVALSSAVMVVIVSLFKGSPFINTSYGYPFILISVPFVISINKQIIDALTNVIKGQRR